MQFVIVVASCPLPSPFGWAGQTMPMMMEALSPAATAAKSSKGPSHRLIVVLFGVVDLMGVVNLTPSMVVESVDVNVVERREGEQTGAC